jgi:hypothetical protein
VLCFLIHAKEPEVPGAFAVSSHSVLYTQDVAELIYIFRTTQICTMNENEQSTVADDNNYIGNLILSINIVFLKSLFVLKCAISIEI